jgi:hypothetical protein
MHTLIIRANWKVLESGLAGALRINFYLFMHACQLPDELFSERLNSFSEPLNVLGHSSFLRVYTDFLHRFVPARQKCGVSQCVDPKNCGVSPGRLGNPTIPNRFYYRFRELHIKHPGLADERLNFAALASVLIFWRAS